MSLFESRDLKPMLLGEVREPFDSPDFIYELKLDGIRCFAFVSPAGVDLRNKRSLSLLGSFPEMHGITVNIKTRCLLDGELIVMTNGKVDFESLQSRVMTTAPDKVALVSGLRPASFVAFDILHAAGRDLIDEPLMARKEILRQTVKETGKLAVSRFIEHNGVAFFELTKEQGLEGIVAKRKESLYHLGKRSKDWLKIKNLIDEDFIACGFIDKGQGIVSLILAQYQGNALVYQGHVTLGVTMTKLAGFPTTVQALVGIPSQAGTVRWFQPPRVCTVTYMERTSAGGMRQPRLKTFRYDKTPRECVFRG